MKAKEYADRYKSNPTNVELGKVALDMFIESGNIVKSRHAKTNSAIFAVMDEIIAKWKTFVTLIDNDSINKDGLELLYAKSMPDIYKAYVRYKGDMRFREWKHRRIVRA